MRLSMVQKRLGVLEVTHPGCGAGPLKQSTAAAYYQAPPTILWHSLGG